MAGDFENSPRMVDEIWQKYKKQSANAQGASLLRQDSEFLDRLIQILQMTPSDFKTNSKKHQIQAALEVLGNVAKLGKCEDHNQDVTLSSSLPTLLISIVRNILKSDVKVPDLVADLVEDIALLCKNGFSKQVGIEPIYMKGYVPLFPQLLKD